MSRKYKKICIALNYVEHFLVLNSAITWCISVSIFGFLISTPVGTTSSAMRLKICAITGGIIKRYKSIIKKNKKKHDKTVFLGK